MSRYVVDDEVVNGKWLQSFRQDGQQYFSRSYYTWCGARYRAQIGGKWQQKYLPTLVVL